MVSLLLSSRKGMFSPDIALDKGESSNPTTLTRRNQYSTTPESDLEHIRNIAPSYINATTVDIFYKKLDTNVAELETKYSLKAV